MKKIISIILLVTILSSMTSCQHKHTWSEWQIAKEATCTENGINTRVCDDCGETQNITIYAKSHSYGEWNTVIPSGCLTNGSKERICSICNYKETQVIFARGQHTGDWTTIQEATCTVDGKQERVCTCGEKETKTVESSHNWEAATCLKSKECTICHEKSGEPLGHTCDIGTCKRCNETIAPIVYLPDLPIEASYRIGYGYYATKATMKITELSYEWVTSDELCLTLSFEKIYDSDGSNAGSTVRFNYRLIDSDGFVEATGDVFYYDYIVGDKVRGKTVYISLTNVALNDSTYTLEIW